MSGAARDAISRPVRRESVHVEQRHAFAETPRVRGYTRRERGIGIVLFNVRLIQNRLRRDSLSSP